MKTMNAKGMTLIELLVVLVISALLLGGIYRVFISQTKAYTVQEQVVEAQQNTRAAMEILLRDLRMAGYDNDRTPLPQITTPVIPGPDSVTVSYEQNNTAVQVSYWREAGGTLMRQETVNGLTRTEALLENVERLEFMYGVDTDLDGAMDDPAGNGISDDWVTAGSIGSKKVVAVHVSLTARPSEVNPDLQFVAPRTLVSAVTFRNLSLMR